MNKKRGIILSCLTGYLLLLAGFTLFSKSVMEKTVPYVGAAEIHGNYIGGMYYDKVLPMETIEFKTTGACVYELIERSTPLGQRLYLKRVYVTILEMSPERTFAALSMSLSPGEKVAVPLNDELEDKMIVQTEGEIDE